MNFLTQQALPVGLIFKTGSGMYKKLFYYAVVVTFILMLFSCNRNELIVAKIDGEKVSQSQVDSLIDNDLKRMRKEALKIYIANKLIEKDAIKRKLTVEEYEKMMIVERAKKVTSTDIEEYFKLENISAVDSNEIEKAKLHLENVFKRFRFEVLIDSLKNVYNVRLPDEMNVQKMEPEQLYSYFIGNVTSKNKIYFIADYDCPECYNKFILINELWEKMPERFQLHYVNYSGEVTEKAKLAEAVYNQEDIWEIHQILFENREVNDSLLKFISDYFVLDIEQLKTDMLRDDCIQKLKQNQQILKEASLFSVPMVIVNDEIYSGNINIETLTNKIQAL
jgi:predicted DsbA family dithiol-disulfide isomerase